MLQIRSRAVSTAWKRGDSYPTHEEVFSTFFWFNEIILPIQLSKQMKNYKITNIIYEHPQKNLENGFNFIYLAYIKLVYYRPVQ